MTTGTLHLPASRTVREAIPRLKRILESHAPDHLQILTPKQMKRSLRMTMDGPRAERGDAGGVWESGRGAAVLVPLCTVGGVPSVIFTLRSAKLSTHAGQVCFPGGHADCGDRGDPVRTALREMREELMGHGPDRGASDTAPTQVPERQCRLFYDFDEGVQILGRTGPVPSVRGDMVTPIIGALTYDLPSLESVTQIFPGNEGEVDEVFAISVKRLLKREASERLERLGTMGAVFPAGGGRGKIWGLTAIILRPILHQLLKPAGFVSGD